MKKISLFLFLLLDFVSYSKSYEFKNEAEVLNFVKNIIPENPTILEAGGFDGSDTLRFKSLWPKSTIHVFEPFPNSYNKMLNNLKNLDQVFHYNLALSDHEGVTDFYVDVPNNAACSIGAPVEFNKHEFDKTPISVPCTTVDSWVMKNNIGKIDFVWLDTEGHEQIVLKEATKILKTVSAIYTEVCYKPIRINSCLYVDLKKFLEDNDFVEAWKRQWSENSGDALFIKKNFIPN